VDRSVVTAVSGGSHLAVRAQPRASRSEVVGVHGDRLKVRLAAPPVEGAANEELCRVVAKALKLPPSRIELVQGRSSRNKILRIQGVSPEEVLRLLGV
jgi:uncharacterized protein (TIGR00251 family)